MDISASNIEGLVKGKSVILDATDNFETRMIVNDAAVKHGGSFFVRRMCRELWIDFFNYSRGRLHV